MSNNLTKLLATFFHLGYSPVAPGSVASLAGVVIYLLFQGSPILYVLLLIVVLVLGFKVCGQMEAILKTKDPSCVVIDEVAGMMIALLFLPAKWPVVVLAYILFRTFDILKIYPLNLIEKTKGSYGIMMDDVVAGLYTNIALHLAVQLSGIS